MLSLGDSGFARTRDDRTIHYVTRGRGAPTVVFEAGMGSSRNAWALVMPPVADHVRAVVYDRSGLGASPADGAPRTLGRAASDLIDLLHHLGPGPFVLVAHSYGGPIVRTAAAEIPDLLAGMVLVDQTDELCALYFSRATRRNQRLSAELLPFAARTRLLRLAVRAATRQLPPEVATAIVSEDSTIRTALAFRAEMRPMTEDLDQLRDHPPPAPTVPVTLISGTRRSRVGATTRAALVAAHRQRAGMLPRGRHVPAEHSGHLVMFSEPDLVTAEILRVVGHA